MNIVKKANCLHKNVMKFYIATIDENGTPSIKGLTPSKYRENIKEIYFTSKLSSHHVQEILKNKKGSVYFTNLFLTKACLLKGEFKILTDEETRKKFWKMGDSAFFEEGYNDADFCVIKFVAKSGRFYFDNKSENFQLQ